MVNFNRNWNGKLDWGIIPTVRLFTVDKYFYYHGIKGKPTKVQLNNRTLHTAYPWMIKRALLKNIPHYIKVADTGLTPSEFDRLMMQIYSKRREWKGEDTNMMILLFVKNFARLF